MTDSLTVTSLDGTASQAIVVTVTGANDAATIGGTASGAIAEDGTLSASGTLTVTDPDAGEARLAVPASLAGTYGSFAFNAATGRWGYTLANGQANVQALAAGQTVSDSLTVASLDGTASRAITVSIAGTNDAPVIDAAGAKLDGSVTGDAAGPADLTATGLAGFADIDLADAHDVAAAFKHSDYRGGQLGTLTATLTADTTGIGTGGALRWSFDVANAAVLRLAAGAEVHETYTVSVDDGHGGIAAQDVTLTITAPGAGPLPPAPAITGFSADTGIVGDHLTADRQPALSGTALAGETVTLLRDGLPVGTAVAASDGTWQVAAGTTPLADGHYSFTATATGPGSSDSDPSGAFALDIDGTAPAAPLVALAATDGSARAGGGYQAAIGTVTLTGTTSPGATVVLAAQHLQTIASNTGGFALGGVQIIDGANHLTLTASDVAGNAATGSIDIDRSGSAATNVVLDWDQLTLDAIKADASDPLYASRAMAIESIAVLDTLNAINGTPAFLVSLHAPAGIPANIAAAAAADAVLDHLYPAQQARFDAALAAAVAASPDAAAAARAVAFGQEMAAAVLALRAHDGSDIAGTADGGTTPGAWRPTYPFYAAAVRPNWGEVTPFVVPDATTYAPAAPPTLDSQAYADALNQVEQIGAATSTTRTADQTQAARFWNDGAGTYTPPGHWNQIAAQVLAAKGLGLADTARVMAELNLAMADAGITDWYTKYSYDLWRPITAIQQADTDGNAATTADPGWTPLLVTPAFPAYASGHSSFSTAAAEVLTALLGTVAFSITDVGLPGVTRSFASFGAAATEAGLSRIWGGIHFSFDNTAGQQIGTGIGDAVLAAFDTTADTKAPSVLPDQQAGLIGAAPPVLTGFALDNLSGLARLQVALDGGALQDVAVNAGGRFSLATGAVFGAMGDGAHTLGFRATDAAGNVGNAGFGFTLDTAAPAITLTSLAAGGALTAASRLTGSVDGTGSAITAFGYSLDGGPVRSLVLATDGRFDAALDLRSVLAGSHHIVLTATDAAGLQSSLALDATLAAAVPFAIAGVTPADGAGDIGVTFRPAVTFTRPVDPASLTAAGFYATDPGGVKIAANIVVSDDGLKAWLLFSNPLPGSSHITLHLDGNAIRAAGDGALLDGDLDGVPGGIGLPGFTTVSTTPIPNTSISGFVVDPGADLKPMTFDDFRVGPDGVPHTADDVFLNRIAHAKVYILGRESEAVYTDAQGRFTLTSVPTGDVKVAIDGRTATNAPAGAFWPEMVMAVTIQPGIDNTIMGSMGSAAEQAAHATRGEVYLPRIDAAVMTPVSDTAPTVVRTTAAAAPDLTPAQAAAIQLVVQPGTALDADGHPVAHPTIGVSTVPPELVRDMLPAGLLQHSFDITIQAPGVAVFTTPVQITLPNVFDAAPGTKLNLLSFDHTTGMLVIDGTGTVSADGLTVVSDPDSGVTSPGWHGMTPPSSDLTVKPSFKINVDPAATGTTSLADQAHQFGKASLKLIDQFLSPLPKIYTNRPTATIGIRGGGDEADPQTASVGLLGEKWGLTAAKGFAAGKVGYYVDDTFFGLFQDAGDRTTVRQSIAHALDAWNKAAGISLVEVHDRSLAGIQLSAAYLDGAGGQIATTRYQGTAGLFDSVSITFDLNDRMLGVDGAYALDDGRLLLTAIEHEFGHAIGLDDTVSLDSVMNPTLLHPGLGSADIAAVRTVYGAPVAGPQPMFLSTALPENTFYLVMAGGQATARGVITASDPSIRAVVPPNQQLDILLYFPTLNLVGHITGTSLASGTPTNIAAVIDFAGLDNTTDSDGDGLSDLAEQVLGTSRLRIDTDHDGLSDLAEISVGGNPLGAFRPASGVVASLSLLGTAEALVLAASAGSTVRETAYIATGAYGMAIVDVSTPLAPKLLSQLRLGGEATGIAMDTTLHRAVVATGDALHIIDVSSQTAPTEIFNVALAATRVVDVDGIAYANNGTMIDAVDLATGMLVHRLPLGGAAITGLVSEGNHLYVMDAARTLTIVDLASGVMAKQGSLGLRYGGGKLTVADGIAYIMDSGGGYATVDVSDPSAPRLVGMPGGAGDVSAAVALNGSGLGVFVGSFLSSARLNVVDTAVPAERANALASYALPAVPRDVAIANATAYVADGTGDLQVVEYRTIDTLGQAPSINITRLPSDIDPATPGIQVKDGSTVSLAATITDDIQVRDIQVLLDGAVVVEDASYPWEFSATLPTIANSGSDTVTLQLRAMDTGGNVTTTAPIILQLVPDLIPPTLTAQTLAAHAETAQSVRAYKLTFSEALASASVTLADFRLVDGKGKEVQPLSVELVDKGHAIRVVFPALTLGEWTFGVDATRITDRAGNALGSGWLETPFTVGDYTTRWIGGSGSWTDQTRWSALLVPTATDNVRLDLGAGASVSVPLGVVTQVDALKLYGAGQLNVSSGTLAVAHDAVIHGKLLLGQGGVLRDATVSADPGAVTFQGGTLDGVTWRGAIDMSVEGASLSVRNGLVLEDTTGQSHGIVTLSGRNSAISFYDQTVLDHVTINMGGVNDFTPWSSSTTTLYFYSGTSSSGGASSVTLGPDFVLNQISAPGADTDYIRGFGAAYGAGTLTNQGWINVAAKGNQYHSYQGLYIYGFGLVTNAVTGWITVGNGSLLSIDNAFDNQGSVAVGAGTLRLDGGFTNEGSVVVGVGGALHLGGSISMARLGGIINAGTLYLDGVIENAGATLVLDTGRMVLTGTIHGGTVQASPGVSVAGGTLDGVTWRGALDLSAFGATLYVRNGLVLEDATGGLPGTLSVSGNQSAATFYDQQVINNATITLRYLSLVSSNESGPAPSLTLQSGLVLNLVAGRYGFYDSASINGTGTDQGSAALTNRGLINVAGGPGEYFLVRNFGLVTNDTSGRITVGDGSGLVLVNGAFDNRGTIALGDGLLRILANFTNEGSVTVDARGALYISSGFSNTGSIAVAAGGALFVTASGTLGSFGTIANAGTLFLNGVIDNAGATLVAGTGTALGTTVLGGTIRGGTVQAGPGFSVSGGTLDGVTWRGALDLTADGGELYIRNGLALEDATGGLSGTLNLRGYSSAVTFYDRQVIDHATINFRDTNSLNVESSEYSASATPSLTLGPDLVLNQVARDDADHTYGYINGIGSYQGAATLTNKGQINVTGGSGNSLHIDGFGLVTNAATGRITVDNGSELDLEDTAFDNQGSITVGDGVLRINAKLTNEGNLMVGAGGTLYLGGSYTLAGLGAITNAGTLYLDGTLDNTGGSLVGGDGTTLGTTVLNGTINGGTVQAGQGLSVLGGTLDAVTWRGSLDLTAMGVRLYIRNGLTLEDATGGLPGTLNLSGDYQTVTFFGEQVLDHATITLGGGYSGLVVQSTRYLGYAAPSLTLGPDLVLNQVAHPHAGYGDSYIGAWGINYGAATLTNQGQINVTAGTGQYLRIKDFGLMTNTGQISIDNGSELDINVTAFHNQGIIEVGSGRLSIDSSITNDGTIYFHQKTDQITNFFSSPTINNGTIWINGSELVLDGVISQSPQGAILVDANASLYIDGGSILGGTIIFGPGGEGLLTIDDASHTSAQIVGWSAGKIIDLTELDFADLLLETYVGDQYSGVLHIETQSRSVELTFMGDLNISNFQFSADANGHVVAQWNL